MNNEQIIRKVLYPNTFKERTKYELQRADVALEKARIDERKQMPPIGINYKGITKKEHEEIKKNTAQEIFQNLDNIIYNAVEDVTGYHTGFREQDMNWEHDYQALKKKYNADVYD